MSQIVIFVGYFFILFSFTLLTYRKQKSNLDFILGGRSSNFWLTALSAHASDMSSWLFLGYPAAIFLGGLWQSWTANGLVFFMFLNWKFVAPAIRVATERSQSSTLSSYFTQRFADTSGWLGILTALLSFFFFTVYISSGLEGLGILLESLLGIPYIAGITVGLFIVLVFVLLGGYTTIAWIDLFQGMFLLAVIVMIPTLLLCQVGHVAPVLEAVRAKSPSISLWQCLSLSVGWGLGYFGQPHIVTKFMGIRNVHEIRKSQIVGIAWQTLVLGAAILIGVMGIYYFPQGLDNPQTLTLELAKASLFPSVVGLVFCAIVAATINVMSAQILITASNISEDLCKKISLGNSLLISRLSVLFVGLIAYVIAYLKISSVYDLVQYAWTGLGASFGPLVLTALFTKTVNRYGAYAGLLAGGLVAAGWDSLCGQWIPVNAMISAFLCNLGTQFLVSHLTRRRLATSESIRVN